MVHNQEGYNQYVLRDLQGPYVEVDYERNVPLPGLIPGPEGRDLATPVTMELDFNAIRVLSQRASILSPHLLLPYDEVFNPIGVQYDNVTHPSLVIWGAQDPMMPAHQRFLFKYAMRNAATVRTQLIPDAGHFSATGKLSLLSLPY